MSDQVEFPGGGGDKLPDQTGETGKYLKSTGTKGSEEWATPAGSGDMEAADYDPGSVVGDAFDMDNMVEGAATLILTDTERAKLAAVAAGADVTGDNAPQAHAALHQNGGADEVSVAGLSGELADDQPAKAHAASHENAGGDEISIAGLSGLLADDQHVLDVEVQAVINLAIRTALQSLMSEQTGGAELERLYNIFEDRIIGRLDGEVVRGLSHLEISHLLQARSDRSSSPITPADIEQVFRKHIFPKRYVMLTCVEYATACTVADGLAYFHVPKGLAGFTLVEVHAEVITAGTTGTMTIEVQKTTTDMLSTDLTIDTGETGSDTAAAPAVIDPVNATVAENDLLRVNVSVLHTTPAEGLIVTLGFALP